MAKYYINTSELSDFTAKLKTGDRVYLSGTVYTARDAAHSAVFRMLDNGEKLPFDIKGAVIYYAGPTPTNDRGRIGSFGPTTSSRMDAFSPRLLDLGLLAMIGKGNRSAEVVKAIKRNNAVYFCAGGGLGALISKSIISSEVIAFPELGCESIKKLEISDMPLITAIDCSGNSIFDR
ncbi:MAG: TRZ/ATZ family protein [Ruminococcaceae bacterium]|nr:TRZ/ATZ family protein [Oscillospiraceae bacterium]MBR3596278.1 fumarate hydratase C-terminal domain-containing protein [Clostridia bacterium]